MARKREREQPARTAVVNVRAAPAGSYVYVGRAVRGRQKASPWGNPFKVGRDGDLPLVLLKYLLHILGDAELLARLPELRGKALGCWCCDDDREQPGDPADYTCHAQVLADLADGPLGESGVLRR